MKKYHLLHINILVLLVGYLTIFLNFTYAEENDLKILHFSKQELQGQQIQNERMLPALLLRSENNNDFPDEVNLLDKIATTGKTRDQKLCGNCWVWASKAAVEAAYTQHFSSKKMISIQYFNSNYYGGGKNSFYSFACYGGNFGEFVKFHNNNGMIMVPADNEGADFVDGDGGKSCSMGKCSNRDSEDISETPYIQLSGLQLEYLNPDGISQEDFINTLKNELNNGRPVLLGLYMTAPLPFQYFWIGSSEIFDPSQYSGTEWDDNKSGGHAVTIIGYNTSSSNPDEHYWRTQNSWGTNDAHPDGTFKLKMNVNYNDTFDYTVETTNGLVTLSFPILSFYTLSVAFEEEASPSSSITPEDDPTPTASSSITPEEDPTPTESSSITPEDDPTPTASSSITPEEDPTPTESSSITPEEDPTPTESSSITPEEDTTPTESPSITPKEDPTPTESPSTTSKDDPTPTESPSTTPKEDPTQTELPSITPDEKTTPTSTPTPAIATKTLLIKLADIFFSGVEGVEVIVDIRSVGGKKTEVKQENRKFLSDKNGNVIVDQIPYGREVNISFQKNGYAFTPSHIQIQPNDTDSFKSFTITVEPDNAYKSCVRYKHNIKVQSYLKNLKKKINREKISSKTESTLKKIYKQFNEQVNNIPTIVFSCKDNTRCSRTDYKNIKEKMNKILISIKRLAKKELKQKRPKSFKEITKLITKTRDEVSKIAKESYTCE